MTAYFLKEQEFAVHSVDRFSYSEINLVFFNTSGAKPHYSQIIKIIRTLKLVGVSDIWYRRSVFLSMKFWLWNLISRQDWITHSMLSKGKWGTSSFFRESLVISEISQNNYELVQNTWHFNNSPAKKLFLLSRNFSSRGRNTGRWCEKSEIHQDPFSDRFLRSRGFYEQRCSVYSYLLYSLKTTQSTRTQKNHFNDYKYSTSNCHRLITSRICKHIVKEKRDLFRVNVRI